MKRPSSPRNHPLIAWASREKVKASVMNTPAAMELVSRYIPGRYIGQITPILTDFAAKGLDYSIEYQGVRVRDARDAQRNFEGYINVIHTLSRAELSPGGEISLRLGWLGLDLRRGYSMAKDYARQLCRMAVNAGAHVIFDMGSSAHTEMTIRMWKQMRQDWPQLGITVQSALMRTPEDVDEIVSPGSRIRLVKGVYKESKQRAYQRQHDIDLAYVRTLRTLMESKAHVLVATHDPRLISIAEMLIRRNHRIKDDHEFQMFYGVRPWEQRRLVDIGHTSRVYIPLGPGWYDYYLHRLVERPANIALFVYSLMSKR